MSVLRARCFSTMPRINDFPWKDDELVSLANRFPTPFHLYDEQIIRNQVRNIMKAFSWCPGFRNYFAVKATPNPYILQVLKEEGCGADCSSVTELVLSEKTGFHGNEVMFTSNNTPIKEYNVAKKMGAIINLDDLSHVDFLHKELGLPELVSFRYNPGPGRTGNVLIGDPKEAKFGNTMAQLVEGYKRCQALGVKHFGLHTMVVSNCLKVDELLETARMLFTLVAQFKEMGIHIEMVNLGGGIGIPYRPEEEVIDVAAVGAGIHELYKELVEAKGLAPLRVVMECGRYITGPAGFLVSRVCHRKKTYKNYIGIDACMADLMRPGMYGAYHHITVHRDEQPPAGLPPREAVPLDNSKELLSHAVGHFDVVGGLCENNDKFAIDRPLNPEPRVGDVVVIHDSGAHGHSMGFNYNGKPRSAEYLYSPDGNVTKIRRAETMDDLFRTLDFDGATDFGNGLKRKREAVEAVEA